MTILSLFGAVFKVIRQRTEDVRMRAIDFEREWESHQQTIEGHLVYVKRAHPLIACGGERAQCRDEARVAFGHRVAARLGCG